MYIFIFFVHTNIVKLITVKAKKYFRLKYILAYLFSKKYIIAFE